MTKPLRHTHPQPPLYLGGLVAPSSVSPDVVTQHQQALSLDYSQLTGTVPFYTKAEVDTAQAAQDATTAEIETDLSELAPIASPVLAGVPTAPTAALGTNSLQLATTAFVLANGGTWPIAQPTSLTSNLTVLASTQVTVFGDFDINATLDVAGTFEAY